LGRKCEAKIVEERDLERYLAEEWDMQTVLPSARILIKEGCLRLEAWRHPVWSILRASSRVARMSCRRLG